MAFGHKTAGVLGKRPYNCCGAREEGQSARVVQSCLQADASTRNSNSAIEIADHAIGAKFM